MKVSRLALALVPFLAACGESGQKAANSVQAATKDVVAAGKDLAAQAAEYARLAPEEAKTKLQGLVDSAAKQLEELRDSEMAQKVVAEVERLFAKLVEYKDILADKLDLAAIQKSAADMVQRFKDDPRVKSAVEKLQQRLDSLTN